MDPGIVACVRNTSLQERIIAGHVISAQSVLHEVYMFTELWAIDVYFEWVSQGKFYYTKLLNNVFRPSLPVDQ